MKDKDSGANSLPKGGFTNIKKKVRAGKEGEIIENGVEKSATVYQKP